MTDMKTMEEHAASAMAHRACCGTEHDPVNGKLHGYCVVCGVEWPCNTAKHYLVGTSDGDRIYTHAEMVKLCNEARVQVIGVAMEEEANRWAERLDWLHTEYGADCSGCDSGDQLDLVEVEIRQAIEEARQRVIKDCYQIAQASEFGFDAGQAGGEAAKGGCVRCGNRHTVIEPTKRRGCILGATAHRLTSDGKGRQVRTK